MRKFNLYDLLFALVLAFILGASVSYAAYERAEKERQAVIYADERFREEQAQIRQALADYRPSPTADDPLAKYSLEADQQAADLSPKTAKAGGLK